MPSLLKYLQMRKNGKAPLNFAYADVVGLPIRGEYGPVSTDDVLNHGEVVKDFKAKVFNLMNEEERKEYCSVVDKAINGWFTILEHDRKWVESEGEVKLLVYLSWAERYVELPKSVSTPDSKQDSKSNR